ncbi:MAG: phosphate ABC transporter substrate-binding protein [Verrucomicrobiota bacterium]
MNSKNSVSVFSAPCRAAFALLAVCAITLPFAGCVAPEATPGFREAQARAEADRAKQVANVMELRRTGTLTDTQALEVLAAINGQKPVAKPAATTSAPAPIAAAPAAPVAAPAKPAAPAAPAAKPVAEPALNPAYKPQRILKGERLRSIGSDSMDELVAELEHVFVNYHEGLRIMHEGLGSSTAMPALLEGRSDFGPISRPLLDAEIERFQARFNYKPTVVRVAVDALGVYVHPDNPVAATGLTLAQLDAIFSATRKRGEPAITTWGQLGLKGDWANAPISIYSRNKASGTYGFFRDEVLQKGEFSPSSRELPGSAAVVSAVAADRYSIGYSGIAYKTPDVSTVPLAKTATAAKVQPGEATALDGRYPLARGLYIAINRDPSKPADDKHREFFAFTLSPVGQEIVRRIGYYPLIGSALETERAKLD